MEFVGVYCTCSVYLFYGQRPRFNDFLKIISRILGNCNYHRVRVFSENLCFSFYIVSR